MKYLNQILAVLLSLPYLIFGANYFFNFIPMPPMEGEIGVFMGVLFKSKFLMVVKIFEIVFGAMILLNYQRPLALILIAPVTVGILMIELFITQQPGIGIIMTLINAFLIYRYKDKYLPILS